MFATPVRLAKGPPGFWRRSLDEFKRQATIAVKMETLHVPTKPRELIRFDTEHSILRCKVMSDKDIGGFSRATLTWVPGRTDKETHPSNLGYEKGTEPAIPDQRESAHALFKGTISTELPPNRPDVQRSGYAAWRTRDRGYSLFGKLLWDIDPYTFLCLRIKSDGRKYFVNIQTESIVPTDLHQHLLSARVPGRWETITIPFSSFVRTNYGMVVEPQKEMLRQKVRSVGLGLIDRVQGPFELQISDIYATNRPPAPANANEDSGFDLAEEEPEERRSTRGGIKPGQQKGEREGILI